MLRTTFSARLPSLAAKRSLRSLICHPKLHPPWPYPPLATNLDPTHLRPPTLTLLHPSSTFPSPNIAQDAQINHQGALM